MFQSPISHFVSQFQRLHIICLNSLGFPGGSDGKESACNAEGIQSLDWEDPLEKGKAAQSSILAWRISPWGHKESDTEQVSLSLSLLLAQTAKKQPAMWGSQVRSLGQEDPLEEEMATHSSILAWKIPWIEEPGGLKSMGLQRVTLALLGMEARVVFNTQSHGEKMNLDP